MSETVMLATAPPRTVSGVIPSLDGVRAIAVMLVFLSHNGLGAIVPGGLGVTIFFVLSGYLITTLMRIELARTGRISFRAFYLRRALRLMPTLLIVVVITSVLAALGGIDGGFSVAGLLSVLLYFGNYFVIAHDFHGLPAGLGVVWSLAIEEHYYLLFPPVAGLLLQRERARLASKLFAAFCVGVLAWRCWLFAHGGTAAYLTMATDTRVDAILVGCLMAIWRNPWLDPVAPLTAGREAAIAAFCLMLLAGTLLYRNEAFRLTLRYSLQNLAIAPLLYLSVARAGHRPFLWLNSRPLVYIGSVSYTIYLVHQVVLLGLERQMPWLGPLPLGLTGAAATLLVAEPLRLWVDKPLAALRRRLHWDRPAPAPAGARQPELVPLGNP
jgi:peptidoglycan/LPS O-acetylase OafA/YrhL